MRSIKLTSEQRRVLLKMRDLYLRNMGALVRRRQQLSAELQVWHLGYMHSSSVNYEDRKL